jgi:hypothetical protein
MDIHKNTSLNIDLSNIIFHYSKELLFKHELKEVMNEFEKFYKYYKFECEHLVYIYHIDRKWMKFSSGSMKYIDYGLNRKYKSYRCYDKNSNGSVWVFYSERD